MEKHEVYLGRRIKRVIFRSSNSILIHTDLHASYNKKAIPESFHRLEGTGL
jgi:putative transposase